MSIRRCYIGLENIALTNDQRDTLINALKLVGPQSDPQPSHISHWRIRTDSDAAILEAAYDDTLLTLAQFKARIAAIFGVAVGSITSSTTNPSYGTLYTLSYQSVPKMRVLLFGGTSATYQESGDAARAYLAANSAAWEEA